MDHLPVPPTSEQITKSSLTPDPEQSPLSHTEQSPLSTTEKSPLSTTEQRGRGVTVNGIHYDDPYYDDKGGVLFFNDKCLICQPNYTRNEKSRFIDESAINNNKEFVKAFECGHGFHLECFGRYLKYNDDELACPVCQSKFTQDENGYVNVHTFSDRPRTWGDHIPEPSAETRYGGNKPNKHRSNKRRQKKTIKPNIRGGERKTRNDDVINRLGLWRSKKTLSTTGKCLTGYCVSTTGKSLTGYCGLSLTSTPLILEVCSRYCDHHPPPPLRQ